MKEFDTIDMNITFYKSMVQLNRKSVYSFIGVIIINIIAILTIIFSDSILSKMTAGAALMNCLWFIFFLIDALQDLRHNKELLHLYKKYDTEKERQESLQEYNTAKDYYLRMSKPDFAEVE